jgi:hypothetical protein
MTAEEFIKVAQEEVGTAEVPENKVKYNKNNGQPWCGYFVMWCAEKIGLKLPNVVYTPAGAAAFQGQGRWKNVDKPAVGDIVFFDFPGGREIDHVGIVIKVRDADGLVVTVEGNTSPDTKPKGSQSNGGEVAKKVRAFKPKNKKNLPVYIKGYGSPKFAKEKK